MKHSAALVFRVVALLVVIFMGITAILPQSTAPEGDEGLPVWADVLPDKEDYVHTVYRNYLMEVRDGNSFGINMPFMAYEAAYVCVALYETLEGIDRTIPEYSEQAGEECIKKATGYGLWSELLPIENRQLTREELGISIDVFIKEQITGEAEIMRADTYKAMDTVLNLYNLGITPVARMNAAYSPWIGATRGDAAMVYAQIIDPSLRIKTEKKDFSELEKILRDTMSGWQGDWSLYYEDYETGQYISINSHQVYSASLIKLFVAEALYDGMADGTISESGAVTDNIRKMLTYSDNDAWSYLARVLGGGVYSRGMAKMTETAHKNGYADTGTFYKGSHRNFNFTSVNDCGAFLGSVLDGTMVSEEYSQKLLDYLKQQQKLHKIPAGVPDNIVTVNKTGELDYIQGDAAIVYAPSGTYILCIIGDNLTNSYGQTGKLVELSKTVYDYLETNDSYKKEGQ